MKRIALTGNPNSGKSTLFNALTGAKQHVGNWPGVTVEEKVGAYQIDGEEAEIVDLPGLYSLEKTDDSPSDDVAISIDYLHNQSPDLIINIVDASSLSRGLFLTTQLLETGYPAIVVVNMIDTAERLGLTVDYNTLEQQLGCPVIPMIANRRKGIEKIATAISSAQSRQRREAIDVHTRYRIIDKIVETSISNMEDSRSFASRLDNVLLNRYLAFPIFLFVMYLLFLVTINVGSAFIDLFDMGGTAIFVEMPRAILEKLGAWPWLTALLADGVGGGVQLVGTFIPVIACLFLFLALLEDTGYMTRVAFILDRLMLRLGLPGKSFVPLIIGFGCNVPSVMATRTMENRGDRILTTIMAPYMSCGARLTVYVLFTTAFFPVHGQNIVFALYLIGIIIAMLSAWTVRRYLLAESTSSPFVLELPPYHLPTLRGVLTHTWHRLQGFVVRAGKAIVLVVVVLNFVNSIGTDGTFGNENRKNSVLSEIGRTITPVFYPLGIDDENWPATVGIFTGMFAKEVVVGTLDALYTPVEEAPGNFNLGRSVVEAVKTVPANLTDIAGTLLDPLGLGFDEAETLEKAAQQQQVEINTVTAMQNLFHGDLGAFSYLLFILLYMPCVATIGVIYKELGSFWAAFSTAWSIAVAYAAAVLCYQIGHLISNPMSSLLWITTITVIAGCLFILMIYWGRHQAPESCARIPVINL